MSLPHCLIIAAITGLSFWLASCDTGPAEVNTKTDTAKPAPRKKPQQAPNQYIPWVLKGNDSLEHRFKKSFSPQQLHLIWTINRIDGNHYQNADTLLVPDVFVDDLLAYAPFPFKVESLQAIPKIALFDYSIQAYGLYENGYLVKWGATSMGSRAHPTPTGLFFCNWKGEEVQSTFDDEWILKWNFNIANKQGIGWHEYALPGVPASHSCLRLLAEDARWMYDWAEEWILKDEETELAKGTPVIVFGEYPFDERKPWLNLLESPTALQLHEEEIETTVAPFLEEIARQQQKRTEVLNTTQEQSK